MVKIRTHHQVWPNKKRVILTCPSGSALLEIFPEPDAEYGYDGYFWGLYVDEPARRKGYAKALLHAAEEWAKAYGVKYLGLEWNAKECPSDIHRWYEREGFEDKEFTPLVSALMIKQLTTKDNDQ